MFKTEISNGCNGNSKIVDESIGLLDEIEYLTGENKELHIKTKQLCL